MAWPLTPLTTYVPSSTPSIKAFDLNSVQNAINRTLDGTYTHKRVMADGVGANTSTNAGLFRGLGDSIATIFQAADARDHNRWSVDGFGYPGTGQVDQIEERFFAYFGTLGAAGDVVIPNTRWLYTQGGAGTTGTRGFLAGYPSPCLLMTGTSAGSNQYVTTNNAALAAAGATCTLGADVLAVADFDIAMNTAGTGNNVDYKIGLTTSPTTGGTGAGNTWDAQMGAWFEKRTANTFWQYKSSDGTLQNTAGVDDGATSNVFQNLKIVVIGANPLVTSARVLFFIDGKLKATNTTRVPSGALNLAVRSDNITAVSRTLYLANTRFCQNRRLSPPASC